MRAAENSLLGLRVRTFEHIHRLSMAEHVDHRRGALVARVTSDIETMAQFTEWGAVAWIVDGVLIVATFGVMAIYSWQLTALALAVFVPLPVLMPVLQRRQLAAYDEVRTAVGETLSEVSEMVTGAPLVQAYGLEERARGRLGASIQKQYRAQMRAARYFAVMFPLGDLFGALALAAVVTVGRGVGTRLGAAGRRGHRLRLPDPAAAGADRRADRDPRPDPDRARRLAQDARRPGDAGRRPRAGRRRPAARGAARGAGRGRRLRLPRRRPGAARRRPGHRPGQKVAIVGETGSGKTTIAKLLCRLADPTRGAIRYRGLDLRGIDADARRRAVRMVPQDGFLFDASIAENVRVGGREGPATTTRSARRSRPSA